MTIGTHDLPTVEIMSSHPQGTSGQRRFQIREAVLLSFLDPLPEHCEMLWDLSTAEWRSLLPWLDTSGLALYFLDRMVELQQSHRLPRTGDPSEVERRG